MRELTLAPNELIHPQNINGSVTWAPGHGLDDLADKLKYGDPSQGWEGDPRLVLARHGTGRNQRWEVWRLEHDSEYRKVCQSPPGMAFPYNLIQRLVEHDQHRGFKLADYVDKHNAATEKRNDNSDKVNAAYEKVQWAIGKDTHTGRGFMSLHTGVKNA